MLMAGTTLAGRVARRLARTARHHRQRLRDAARDRVLPARHALSDGAGLPSDAVALTFDDGPDPVHTPQVLDELSRLGVRATFFLVGSRAAAHPELVRRIRAEGHAVGSHSSTHPEPWTLGLRSLARDYRNGRRQVAAAAGVDVRLFRPPKGFWDLKGALAARTLGVEPWRWTIDPEDWVPGVAPQQILDGLGRVDAGDVILLHDAIEGPLDDRALDRTATVRALEGIVARVDERGLRLVTLTPAPR